jgi:hypothetical protein
MSEEQPTNVVENSDDVEEVTDVKEDVDDSAETEESGDYVSRYIKFSVIKELFKIQDGDNTVQVRIAGTAKNAVKKYLDNKIVEGVTELLDKLPRKSKGDMKGQLKRFTIRDTDL